MFLCQLYCVHKHMVHTVISIVGSHAYVVCVCTHADTHSYWYQYVWWKYSFPSLLCLPSSFFFPSSPPFSSSPPCPPLPPLPSPPPHCSYHCLDSNTSAPNSLPTSFCSQHRLVVWSSTSGLPTLFNYFLNVQKCSMCVCVCVCVCVLCVCVCVCVCVWVLTVWPSG